MKRAREGLIVGLVKDVIEQHTRALGKGLESIMGFAKGIDWVARPARLRVLNLITLSSGSPTRSPQDSGLRYWLLSINYLHVWGNEILRLLGDRF